MRVLWRLVILYFILQLTPVLSIDSIGAWVRTIILVIGIIAASSSEDFSREARTEGVYEP